MFDDILVQLKKEVDKSKSQRYDALIEDEKSEGFIAGLEFVIDLISKEQPSDESEKYLLQNCTAGFVGNSPLFWRKGGSGYTQWVNDAEIWTKEDAELQIRSTRGSHEWKMWPVNAIHQCLKSTVDIQDLRKSEEASTQSHRDTEKTSIFDEAYKAIREAGGDAWDQVEDVERELKIIRGQPIEWAEAAIKEFEEMKDRFFESNPIASDVAAAAIAKFKELLK